MKKKFLAVLACMLTVPMVMGGCSGDSANSSAPASSDEASSSAEASSSSGETVKITAWLNAPLENEMAYYEAFSEKYPQYEIEASDDLYDAWVGTNTTNEGITAGNWLAEYLGDADANILVIEGSVGASATLGRTDGFNQVAGEHDNWTILDSQSGDFTQAGGQEVMESFIKSYEGQFNVVICQNDNEAYGAMDAMDAAGITYGVDGDVTLISFDATHDGLQYTLDGKINCDVECNPIQAETVKGVIEKMQAGEDYEKTTLVEDQAFVAPGIESEYATTMTQEVLDGRAY